MTDKPPGLDYGSYKWENIQDRKYKAEDYEVDPSIRRKDNRKVRKCTDVICAITFITVILLMIISCIYSYLQGQPGKYMAPIDQEGNICGFTGNMTGYPYLYIANIKAAALNTPKTFSYGVCVKKCPDGKVMNTSCSPGFQSQCNEFVTYGTWELMGYCIPVYDEMSPSQQVNFDNLVTGFKSSNFGGIVYELYMSKWVMLICIVTSAVLALGYIQLMKFAAWWMAWISVFAVWIGLILTGVFAYMGKNQAIVNSILYNDQTSGYEDIVWYKVTYWTCWILAGLYCICGLCKYKALTISIGIIETASEFYAQSQKIVFVPLLYFIIGISMFSAWCIGLCCVCSMGEIKVGSILMQTKDVERDAISQWMIAGMVIGMVWFVEFLIAANQFTIICAAVDWYYDPERDTEGKEIEKHTDIHYGLGWAWSYQIGTLAFGSFIMTLVDLIRFIFEYLGDKMTDASGNNACTACLVRCMKCCVECFDRLMRYINMNAYIYCAIASTPFCESALNAFLLQLKNAAKFAFVNSLGSMFMFLAQCCIALITTLIGWLLCKFMVPDGISHMWLCLILIFLVSYSVASAFVSIYDSAANTCLQCFILDKELAGKDDEFDTDGHVPEKLEKFFEDMKEKGNSVNASKEEQLTQGLHPNDMN